MKSSTQRRCLSSDNDSLQRKNVTTKLWVSALLLLVLSVHAEAGDGGDKSTYTPVSRFDSARDPAKDLKDAVVEAQRTGKRIILDVGGEWCVWCHRLDSLFQRNKDLDEFLRTSFVVVKINFSKENKNEGFLSQFPKIDGYPHLFVLHSDGKLLHSQNTGDLEEGKAHSRERVFAFLKKWSPQPGK